MNKQWIKWMAVPALLLSFTSHPLAAQPADNHKEEVIVVYKNATGKKKALAESVEVDHQFKYAPAVSVTMEQSDVNKLKKDRNIAYIEKNVVFKLKGTKSKVVTKKQVDNAKASAFVSSEESQWSYQTVKANEAAQKGITGKGVKVAVIDSGIAPHSDLAIAGGTSTVDYTSSWVDDNGHGTHVAGIIAARRNGSGIVGVAPDAKLYAVKTMNKDGEGTLQDILEGIDWSIANGMDIINMSLGTEADSRMMHDMIDKAYQKGIVVVGAAGNDGTADGTGNTVDYPAKYDSVIAVAAIDNYLKRGSFSSTGNEVEVSAPGVKVLSTYTSGYYAYMSGTSQATPHITGLLALLKQQNPTLSGSSLRKELLKHITDLGAAGRDPLYGYGLATYGEASPTTPVSTVTPAPAPDNTLLTALEEAANKLVQANSTKRLWDYDSARQAISKLPDQQEKSKLQLQLDQIRQQLGLVEFSSLLNISPTHTLTIRFSQSIDPKSVTPSSVFVRNEGEFVNGLALSTSSDGKTVTIQAPSAGYVSGGTYFLYVDTTVTSPAGKALKAPVIVRFTIS
ncbi:S8 family serine peptidase [Bacillus sp. FJAT-27231]|uniref:S8 family serine peptidase n=1 Tax=Bacillus sp. FJAT-27231 TaxID=1679168 RepID=UPI00069D9FDE|nr:S8 family serine peptidase [Bacillus sp. FJAT-27231]